MELITKREFYQFLNSPDLKKKSLKLLIFDIDNSKKLFGESINKKSLNIIVETMNELFGESKACVVGRDAISLLLIDVNHSIFDIAKLKEKLQYRLKQKTNLQVTFCLGIAEYPNTCKKFENIFAFASEALFLAKIKGENSIEILLEENMKLKSTYFRKTQLEKLQYYAKKTRKSEAEIIRVAIDHYLTQLDFDV